MCVVSLCEWELDDVFVELVESMEDVIWVGVIVCYF